MLSTALAQIPHLEFVGTLNDFASFVHESSFLAGELDQSDMQARWSVGNYYGSTAWLVTFHKPLSVDLYAALCGAAQCLVRTSLLA